MTSATERTPTTTEQTTMNELSTGRMTGKVKWFNNTAGFGFITACDGEEPKKDIFVHYSAILVENTQYKYLIQGEYVDYDLVSVESDKYEFQAVKVSGVKGGTIMCETRRQAMESNTKNQENRYEQPRKSSHRERNSSTVRDNRDYRDDRSNRDYRDDGDNNGYRMDKVRRIYNDRPDIDHQKPRVKSVQPDQERFERVVKKRERKDTPKLNVE
jgi:cold shock protein